jgi:hypothetical protein
VARSRAWAWAAVQATGWIDLAAVHEGADAGAGGGGPVERGEQALAEHGLVGVLAQGVGEGDVLHAAVRAAAARDGDEEGEGVGRVVLALGDVQVHAVAVGVDAVGAQEGVTGDAGAGELAVDDHADLAPGGPQGPLAEAAAQAGGGEGEEAGEHVRRREHGHGLAWRRRGELGEGGAGELAAEGELLAQSLLVGRGEAQEAIADLGVPDPALPAEHGVLALAVGEHEQVAVAGEHEVRGVRGSREDVHAGGRAT